MEAVQDNMVLLSGVDLVDGTVSFPLFVFASHTNLDSGFLCLFLSYNFKVNASICDVDDLNHKVKLIV